LIVNITTTTEVSSETPSESTTTTTEVPSETPSESTTTTATIITTTIPIITKCPPITITVNDKEAITERNSDSYYLS